MARIPNKLLSDLLLSPVLPYNKIRKKKNEPSALQITGIHSAGDVVHVFSHIKKTYRTEWVVLEGGDRPPPLKTGSSERLGEHEERFHTEKLMNVGNDELSAPPGPMWTKLEDVLNTKYVACQWILWTRSHGNFETQHGNGGYQGVESYEEPVGGWKLIIKVISTFFHNPCLWYLVQINRLVYSVSCDDKYVTMTKAVTVTQSMWLNFHEHEAFNLKLFSSYTTPCKESHDCAVWKYVDSLLLSSLLVFPGHHSDPWMSPWNLELSIRRRRRRKIFSSRYLLALCVTSIHPTYRSISSVLNLNKGASQAEINERHRALSLIFHPDKQRDEASKAIATRKFLEIQKAYQGE